MESLLINVNVSYKRVTSARLSELRLCLLFLNNNQPKIILMPKRYFGVAVCSSSSPCLSRLFPGSRDSVCDVLPPVPALEPLEPWKQQPKAAICPIPALSSGVSVCRRSKQRTTHFCPSHRQWCHIARFNFNLFWGMSFLNGCLSATRLICKSACLCSLFYSQPGVPSSVSGA